MNGPSKLECYTVLGWKGLPVTNTLAIGPVHKLRRKWDGKRSIILNIQLFDYGCTLTAKNLYYLNREH
jgi:hypothetical protein